MKKILYLTLTIIALILNINTASASAELEKTIIVTLDSMDFDRSKELINENLSMGLMNIKTMSKNETSLFMTIGTGRKVKIPNNITVEISNTNNGPAIKDYDKIKSSLDKSYPNFSKNMNFLGQVLENNNIKTSYIGDKNKSDALMIANNQGRVDYWQEKTPYEKQRLEDSAKDMLSVSDVLLIAFDIEDDEKRVELLAEFLKTMKDHKIIVFPKTVSGDMDYKLNDSMVPIFYGDSRLAGGLSSKSTKRNSVITSLDLLPTIASHNKLELGSSIGNPIDIYIDTDLVEHNRQVLLEFLNLNIIKYIIHALVTMIFIYLIYVYRSKEEDFKNIKVLLNAVIISIALSIILGAFHLHRSIIGYIAVLIVVSLTASVYFDKKNIKVVEKISIVTNILILISVFFNHRYFYNSFIGYNSIVAGGRFYGFNNEIMGVLIATSIVVYYSVRDKLKNKTKSNIFLMIYLPIVIIALTGNFGANFGGFLSSIIEFLILIYLSLFNRKVNIKTIFALLAIGALILVVNLYLDVKDVDGSHAGNLLERINILGFYELIDMIIKKIKQLFFMLVIPPWSIVFISQIYFIISKFKKMRKNKELISIKFIVMFIASFIALAINDTGVVAFVYMNTYLISNVLEER